LILIRDSNPFPATFHDQQAVFSEAPHTIQVMDGAIKLHLGDRACLAVSFDRNRERLFGLKGVHEQTISQR
jgi:hypothetical protein